MEFSRLSRREWFRASGILVAGAAASKLGWEAMQPQATAYERQIDQLLTEADLATAYRQSSALSELWLQQSLQAERSRYREAVYNATLANLVTATTLVEMTAMLPSAEQEQLLKNFPLPYYGKLRYTTDARIPFSWMDEQGRVQQLPDNARVTGFDFYWGFDPTVIQFAPKTFRNVVDAIHPTISLDYYTGDQYHSLQHIYVSKRSDLRELLRQARRGYTRGPIALTVQDMREAKLSRMRVHQFSHAEQDTQRETVSRALRQSVPDALQGPFRTMGEIRFFYALDPFLSVTPLPVEVLHLETYDATRAQNNTWQRLHWYELHSRLTIGAYNPATKQKTEGSMALSTPLLFTTSTTNGERASTIALPTLLLDDTQKLRVASEIQTVLEAIDSGTPDPDIQDAQRDLLLSWLHGITSQASTKLPS